MKNMMTISRQDITKTILIIWFVGTTVYVANDLYTGYKIRGVQAAYRQGYGQSVDDLISKVQQSGCQPFQVQKDGKTITLANAGSDCMGQAQTSGQQAAPAEKAPVAAQGK